ncbi:MAG: formylglycine-generating enzyme family protein, partial [Chitinophagaceae bacterium]
PRIGIDERNQFDFYRDMPGGLAGVRKVVDEFHKNNVKVFVNYNPWDTSTRREGKSDVDALVEIIAAIDADGIFLDTLKEVESVYRGKLNNIKPGIVLEGETAADIENIPTNHASWAQWFSDKYVPGVLRNKWFERRHMQHQIARWDRDHTTELQQAWMNGSGVMVWENVFGQWLGWSERDKSIYRAMLPIQRRYHSLFIGEKWTPLVETLQEGVFASLWEGDGVKLWTIVNRLEQEVKGDLLKIDEKNAYNVIAGKKIDSKTFSGILRPRSIACIVSGSSEALGKDFRQFLSSMERLDTRYASDATAPTYTTSLKKPRTAKSNSVPPGMVLLQPHTYNQRVEILVREVGDYKSAMDVNVSDQLNRPYLILRKVHIKKMAIDKYPVTNSDFAEFIQATSYKPLVSHLFLHHWQNGTLPAGKENHPVVYVSLDDARAYARWKGKRLATEPEWQYAAGGYDQLRYPWGNELKKGLYNDTAGTTPVDAYPDGVSPFGVYDMCGNTWEFTESEHADEHNRFCMLKG